MASLPVQSERNREGAREKEKMSEMGKREGGVCESREVEI